MDKELLYKIKALMAIRVIIISLFLGTLILLQIRLGQLPLIKQLSILIAIIYALTILYALLLKQIKNLIVLGYIQIIADLLIESGIIYITGGVDSPFSFLYTLSIISGSIVLYKPGGYAMASGASILYGLLTNFELYGLLQPLTIFPKNSEYAYDLILYNVSLNICVFYLIAFLSGYLSEKLKKTGEELNVQREDLSKLKKFHENLVKNMGNGLVTVELNSIIISFNRAAEIITGFKKNDVLGKNIYNFFNLPYTRPPNNFNVDVEKKLSDPIQKKWEGFFNKPSGHQIFIGMTLSEFKNDINKTIGYIGVFQDLTETKKMEAKILKTESLAAVGRVAAGIAHEIRNPLASMSGSIQVLKERLSIEDTDKKLMEIIVRETQRLDRIITDFLNFATPSTTKDTKSILNEIIKETLTLLSNHPTLSKGVKIKTILKTDDDLIIKIDPVQLRHIFWNLCINSLQAMKNGDTLTIETQKLSIHAPYNSVEIIVKDSGMGISKEDLSKVYDPFFTTKKNGTGLGLSTVYKIVHQHKGVMKIESKNRCGTKIKIRIPI